MEPAQELMGRKFTEQPGIQDLPAEGVETFRKASLQVGSYDEGVERRWDLRHALKLERYQRPVERSTHKWRQ